MLLISSKSLLTFCLLVLSITERVLKSPHLTLALSVSPLNWSVFSSCVLKFYSEMYTHLVLFYPLDELTLLYM